jgi:hypothetical protein
MFAAAARLLASCLASASSSSSTSCYFSKPPFCTSAGGGRDGHGPATNWSCASRASYPDPCDVCYHGGCGRDCKQCTGPLPPPPPPTPPPLPPSDWAARVTAAQMVFSRAQIKAGFTPALGNGFISGDAGCCTRHCQHCQHGSCRSCHSICKSPFGHSARDSALSGCGRLHLAGVFNGALGGSPTTPNRASISNPHSVYVLGATEWVGGALDIERGIFFNRSVSKVAPFGCPAQLTYPARWFGSGGDLPGGWFERHDHRKHVPPPCPPQPPGAEHCGTGAPVHGAAR